MNECVDAPCNATVVAAGAFTISRTKCQQRSLLKEFEGTFEFFCMDGRRGLLIPPLIPVDFGLLHHTSLTFKSKIKDVVK
jgi:hypothetical protein